MEPKDRTFVPSVAWGTGGFALAGSTVVVGRALDPALPPFLTVVLSLLAGLPLLAWLARPRRWPTGPEVGRAALQALGGVVLFRLLLLEGTKTVDGLAAGLLLGLGPLLLGLGGRVFWGDRLGSGAWVGLGLATLGLALVRGGAETRLDLMGALCLLGAVGGEVAMSLVGRRTPAARSAENAWWTIVLAVGIALPGALVEVLVGGWPPLGAPSWGALVYYGVGPTALGYWAWSHAASRLDSATLGATSLGAPVAAALLSTVVLGEPLGWWRVGALAVMVTGLVLFGLSRRPRGPRCPPSLMKDPQMTRMGNHHEQ